MWLKLALKSYTQEGSIWLMVVLGLLFFSACSPSEEAAVDKLNFDSYVSHYRDIDATEHYARQVLQHTGVTDGQQAEALNNLAFVSIVRMDYQRAEQLLDSALDMTDNQVELLISEIQHMRLCQRRSQNRAFYEHREQAAKHLNRINEERSQLTPHMLQRLTYAESEMAIVNSTYYYYVGLERQSIAALQSLNLDEVRRDTAQYLNYLYNVGAGGILTEGTPAQIHDEEIDYLKRCLQVAQRHNYPYFEAQALEALAEHTGELQLAEDALALFQQYGDVYQIAGAYRTVASCYHAMDDDMRALENLEMALADTIINQAPDLVASIREQLSVAYAAIDEKPQSDYNRNIYIDLQEQTRQDRELEARAAMLDRAVSQLNWMMLAVVGAIVLLLFLLWLFNHLHQKRKQDHRLDDLLEQKNEEVAEARLRVEKNERRHLEQRAKVSLAMSILPLIDRILHEVRHLDLADNPDTTKNPANQERLDYIRELTDNINEQNDLLTQWIQLRQGELNLHIESFPLQQLFDIVERSKTAFKMKGITLDVCATEATVKADRVLTLFMLNTLADNARKFTPEGGKVSINAQEETDYVEISVADTGCGMNEQQLAHVFDAKPIRDDRQHKAVASSSLQVGESSHGFGLMNCKGIIEKYRKMSQLFGVCLLSAESEEGRGSRFYFRLPKGMIRLLVVGFWLLASGQQVIANSQLLTANSPLDSAHIYADSAFFSNINGNYERTLLFADSCRRSLNNHYLQQYPQGRLLMTREGSGSVTPAEIQWLHNGVTTNYQIVLDIRNESAVAALALHDWALYEYNNKVYTQLFKELSADNLLADYCRAMQQSQSNKRIAVILLLLVLVMIVPAYYMLYYRHRLNERYRTERLQMTNIEMAEDELRRAELENAKLHVSNAVLDNCLSTLKHETMYYPSRIRQLIETGQHEQLAEVTGYYRDLYSILIQQAMSQVERIHLHLHPVQLYGQTVLGDEHLLRFLFEILKPTDVKAEPKDDKYVVYQTMTRSQLSTINYHLLRQIIRDHGEATNRRACGIKIEENNQVNITLPRYNGKV